MLTLMIVEDELIVRRGLTTIVDWPALGFEIAGVYADGREAIEHLSKSHVDVILTDVMMTFVSGLEVAKYAAEHAPDTRVVIVSGYQEFDLARQAMTYGVVDYLLKPTQIDELTACFRRVHRRVKARSEELARMSSDRQPIRRHEGLLLQPQDQQTGEQNVIGKVQAFIEKNCHRDITMYDVAEAVNYNPVYLSRMYKEKTGENYLEYLTRIRMNRAMGLLADPGIRIADISRRVGYKSQKYFAKLFRRATGMSPQAYRDWASGLPHQ